MHPFRQQLARNSGSGLLWAEGLAGLLLSNFTAEAERNAAWRRKLPAGLDLGSTGFYDWLGETDLGFFDYLRWNHFTFIKDIKGQNSPLFDPRIDVISTVLQVVYVPPLQTPNGAISFEALLPIVDFQSHLDAPSMLLHDNGLNIGHATFGVAYQSKPITLGNQSVLSWRVDLDFIAPTGGFDSKKDINQSSGFWSVAPYLINFASSYEAAEGFRPGLNGFWLQQFTDD